MRAEKAHKVRASKDVYTSYEEALRLLHDRKYEKAKTLLQKLVGSASDQLELLARINELLKVCEKRLADKEVSNLKPDALVDRAVMLHNKGQYEEALHLFEQAAKAGKSGGVQDYAHYGMAATEAARGNTDKAIQHLKKAIELKNELRFMARSDPDFAGLAENTEFRELVRSPEK